MASAAVVGPPPGLGPPQTSSAKSMSSSLDGKKYSRSFLLQLSQSPLVNVPTGIPPFAEWFGEWESYTPRPNHHQHNQHAHERHNNHRSEFTPTRGNRYTHIPEDGSGPMGEFSFHKSSSDSNSSTANASGGYLTGFQGVRRREGDRAERAEGSRGGFRKYEGRNERGTASEEQGEGLRSGNPRFPSSGKNPFGQLSASGTFKPAGKDGADPSNDKRGFPLGSRMASYGRNDREPTQFDENGRPIRLPRGAARDQQRRRQEGAEEGADGGEWETVPRSPESERRLARAGGLADSASDWRKGSGASGPNKRSNDSIPGRGGLRGSRNDTDGKRGVGGSSAFPSWMADPSETPSWMDDSPTASSNTSLPTTSEKRERGRLNFDAFKGADAHVTPLEGEDSIQAFKREMKRREAEARAKEMPEEVKVSDAADKPQTNKLGPPPGLSRSQDGPSHEGSQTALGSTSGSKPPGLSHADQSSDTPTEPTASSAKPAGSSEDSEERRTSNPPPNAASGAGGRGSSRFARFFDGAAATNRAKEAQERAMAAHAATGGMSASQERGHGTSSGTDAQSQSVNADGMAALFANMGLKQQNQIQQESNSERGSSSPQPTSADMQGMQKIMAMLRGGGGSTDGAHGSNSPSAGSAGQAGTVSGSSANLMAMLAGASKGQGRPEAPPSPHQQSQSSQNQNQRHSLQSGPPPGFDLSRLAAGGGRESPTQAQMQHGGAGFGGSSGMPNRSQSPGVPFRNDHGPPQQYGSQAPGPYGQGPPPGFGGRSNSAFGLDPRMMGRPSPGGGSMHGAESSPAVTPGGGAGSRNPNGHGGDGGGGPSLANLPPHIQQQLMGLPPHVQHAILSGQARGPMPSGPPPFHPSMQGMPPPPGMGGPPQGPPHHLGPFGPPPSNHSPHPYGLPPFLAGHQGPYGGGNGGSSPGGMPLHHLGPYSPNAGHSAMSPHPSAASPHGPPPPGAGGSGGGFPPGLMHGPPPGIYGGGQGR